MFSCTGVDNGLNAQIEVNLYWFYFSVARFSSYYI